MKKTVIALTIIAALTLPLTGCGNALPGEIDSPATEPQVTADVQTPAEDDGQAAPSETAETAAESGRQDGERFEAVIMLEGMEETVQYEHLVNGTAGFEMDYDYENFVRRSEGDREVFISDWDDLENPENYLEVTSDTGNFNLVADAISATLSNEYDPTWSTRELDNGGSCIRIEGSVIKGTNLMADHLQVVYVIPAGSGSIVAKAHYAIEGAEGYGRRFAYMVMTLAALESEENGALSDEQALTAIQNYCYANNPDLESLVNAGEHQVYWELSSSDEHEIVVLFRSYTGAQIRYYIDRITGDTYVTEFVPGITAEEERTEESLNVWDYLG